ncbi:MAG: ribonuclease P protein component [Candidatus Doudnabacteria bacterium CG10_big_fil_rev_8_21_14_0_10_41_10]|uniref:Ribonuclease P protein component n=1 Tax=Candidatus Doudnabacteria bacterium CG10_big_fil_rev_8_21_14_0_10_41_10 TaxID=1974551 RepID=A0A2H0VC61_9BACT|nr:MAG: ribonuclease P protein component [Candidatus Doudnabacteria bacterium CG10_big_fil_rev_8_21_14_0_10_41_10]
MLPKQSRLSKEKDIVLVLRRGRRLTSSFMNLNVLNNHTKVSRFGFIVSKKVAAKPIKRNLIKRRMRNIIGKHKKNLLTGFDCLFVTKPPIKLVDYQDTEKELLGLLERAGQVKKKPGS